MKKLLFLLSLLLMSVPAVCRGEEARAPDAGADALVKRVVEAYGGEEAIRNVKTVFASGEMKSVRGRGMYRRYMEREKKMRVVIDYAGSSEVRFLNGKRAWLGGEGVPAELAGFQLLATLFQYKQLDLPYGLFSGNYKVKHEGSTDMGGRKAEVIGLDDGEGPPMRAYVDAESGRIIIVEGFFDMGGGKKATLAAEFEDFRVEGGVLMPHRITSYADGQEMAETLIRGVKTNMKMEGSLFRE